MKLIKLMVTLLTLLGVGVLVGCSGSSSKSPDITDSIRKSLDQVGLKDIAVSKHREKGMRPSADNKLPVRTIRHKLNP
jgi:hypothetical protein